VTRIIDDQVILSRVPEGPLAAHIGSFVGSLREQGYALSSIRRHVSSNVGFNRWLKQKGIAVHSITPDQAVQYLRYRARRLRIGRSDRGALSNLLEFLERKGVISAKKMPAHRPTPAERCTQAYEHHLREARGLAEATIDLYLPFIRSFLEDRFGDGPVTLSRLCARDVVRFVQRQAQRLRIKRAKLLTSALRSFLQYARYRGDVKLDLSAAVPTVANWSMSSIPRAISADQVRRLLASIDRHTPMGRRDYAILLLLARLGLRAGAVTFLELDDIDWKAGQLRVCAKGGQRSALPLPAEVGKAIVAYLRHGRPKSNSRRVFLRAIAPIRGLNGHTAIAHIVERCLQRAGIDAPTNGAHQFRHGLATEMLRAGASLSEIGELLDHRSPETTKIYIKVDLDALRTLAPPWPGGVQ
jgi:integrase/recombinase XerD